MNEPIDVSEQTPGQILKAVRESKRISISEVVQRLLLSKQVVNSLEEDDYTKISAQVYAEGYLKAYAQFLEIPVDTVIKSFRRLNIYSDVEVKVDIKPQTENLFNIDWILKDRRIRFLLLGIVGVLVLSVLIFFISRIFIGKSGEITVTPSATISTTNTAGNKEQLPLVRVDHVDLNQEKIDKIESKQERINKRKVVSDKVDSTATDTLDIDIPSEDFNPKNSYKKNNLEMSG